MDKALYIKSTSKYDIIVKEIMNERETVLL